MYLEKSIYLGIAKQIVYYEKGKISFGIRFKCDF